MDFWLKDFAHRHRLGPGFADTVEQVHRPLATRIGEQARKHGSGFLVGLCGPQGSGKSTLALVLGHLLTEAGLSVVVLSLDDLYLTRAERRLLAQTTHPLFATRGPPGTHDVALGLSVLNGLARPEVTLIPRFDKAMDERNPPAAWEPVQGPVDVILFEGWCVGARPQAEAALAEPVNALEREEDAEGVWRGYVNAALAGAYQTLFARIDLFVLLQPPSFDVVARWRLEQERKLAEDRHDGAQVMNAAQVRRFVQHYERLTRWLMAEAPARADGLIRLDAERRPDPPIWRPAEPYSG